MRVRPTADKEVLDRIGDQIAIVEAQGHWSFVACERLFEHVSGGAARYVVLETGGIGSVDRTAAVLMEDFVTQAAERGQSVVLAGRVPEQLLNLSAPRKDTLDLALEWCENRLLREFGGRSPGEQVSLAESDLCRGLDETDVEALGALAVERSLLPGEVLMKRGEPDSSLVVVLAGHLTAEVEGRQVAAFGPGSLIGEMGFLTGEPRTANVVADESCSLVEIETLDELPAGLRAEVTRAIGIVMARRLSATTAEVAGA